MAQLIYFLSHRVPSWANSVIYYSLMKLHLSEYFSIGLFLNLILVLIVDCIYFFEKESKQHVHLMQFLLQQSGRNKLLLEGSGCKT